LAAQKTVENLIGGVALVTDQPVRVGDFCRFGDRAGTVETIGFRSTRVRTLERTVVTIPNAEFAGLQLENFGKRDQILFRTTLGLRYETTPDQIRHILVEVERMLSIHPKVAPDSLWVRFVGFGAYSLNLQIFAYIRTREYGEFLIAREEILLRLMDIVHTSGSDFAFPSQTMYLGGEVPLDAEKARAAEAQVQTWLESGKLPRRDSRTQGQSQAATLEILPQRPDPRDDPLS